ncbi:hypothetical protein Tco_1045990 [Tanacetum coccineum]
MEQAIDSLSLVKYVFPIERLPEWVRLTLQNSTHSDETRGIAVGTSISKRFNLDKWPISVFGSASKNNRVNDDKNMDAGNLYLRLLQAYLRFFVPFTDLNAQSPYRSSLLHYSSGYDSLVLENVEFFVHILIHFWILDNDFSPLPVKVCKSFGVVLPLRSVLAKLPPTPGLVEVVNVLVKYLNSSLVSKAVDQVEVTALRGATFAVDMGMSASSDARILLLGSRTRLETLWIRIRLRNVSLELETFSMKFPARFLNVFGIPRVSKQLLGVLIGILYSKSGTQPILFCQSAIITNMSSQETQEETQDQPPLGDVGGDAFDSMEDVGFLEFADLSLDEPEFENDLIIDN